MTTIDERNTEAWESGDLGRDAVHARRVSIEVEEEVDRALAMKLVTIRLPLSMIDALKSIAQFHGIGYQPMVRDLLGRFIDSEVPLILAQMQRNSADSATEKTAPVDRFMARRAAGG